MKAGVYNNVQINSAGKIIAVGNIEYALSVELGQVSYFDTLGTNISITTASDGSNNFVAVNPATTLDYGVSFDNGGTNDGTLAYTGQRTDYFQLAASLSVSPVTSNDKFAFAFAKNGTILNDTRLTYTCRTNLDISIISLHGMVELSNTDEIQIYVSNMTSIDDITVFALSLIIHG